MFTIQKGNLMSEMFVPGTLPRVPRHNPLEPSNDYNYGEFPKPVATSLRLPWTKKQR